MAVLRERVHDFYRDVAFEPRHIENFRRAIEAGAQARLPILIHCAVGKDRTGLLASLIQHILGVSEADQITEFLLTRQDRRLIDELNARLFDAARKLGKTLNLEASEAMTSVHPENLEIAWAAIRERHGSIDAYVAALGIAPETAAAIRAAYLV